AERYDLRQIGIAGVDPETEPSPQRLLALESVVQEAGVTTIFFETSASPKVARTLARNLDIDSEELDNLETQQSPESDYPQVMRDNCARLVASWTCTPPPPPSSRCPGSPWTAAASGCCTTSTCGSGPVSWSPCWAPTAPASRPCCAPSSVCCRRRPAPRGSSAARSSTAPPTTASDTSLRRPRRRAPSPRPPGRRSRAGCW